MAATFPVGFSSAFTTFGGFRRPPVARRREQHKLATYALRRRMAFADRKLLAKIAERSKADGYRLRGLIENLVLSDLFQKR